MLFSDSLCVTRFPDLWTFPNAPNRFKTVLGEQFNRIARPLFYWRGSSSRSSSKTESFTPIDPPPSRNPCHWDQKLQKFFNKSVFSVLKHTIPIFRLLNLKAELCFICSYTWWYVNFTHSKWYPYQQCEQQAHEIIFRIVF